MSGRLDYHVTPGTPLSGRIRMPGDKSISHRALLLAALARGESVIEGLSDGADVRATARALTALGVDIAEQDGAWRVRGAAFRPPAGPLDLGNSGTAARLLLGLLAGQAFDSVLCGDASLSSRPMGRVLAPLRQMGGRFQAAAGDTLPVTVQAGGRLSGIHYRCPVPSAQVKSALLFALACKPPDAPWWRSRSLPVITPSACYATSAAHRLPACRRRRGCKWRG